MEESNLKISKRLKRRDSNLCVRLDFCTGEVVESKTVLVDGKLVTINNRTGNVQVLVDDLENDISTIYYLDINR